MPGWPNVLASDRYLGLTMLMYTNLEICDRYPAAQIERPQVCRGPTLLQYSFLIDFGVLKFTSVRFYSCKVIPQIHRAFVENAD